MTDMMVQQRSDVSSLLPLPPTRSPITIRAAVMQDLAFIDRLQKMHTHAVGWMPTQQLEGSIQQGRILIAEEVGGAAGGGAGGPVGYLMGADRYFKRDDVGIIYQMNVLPAKQRGFVGAALLKAQFERSAYGCRLYCCWCAQDLAANRFWEAMGFVPLAFRTGSRKSGKGGSARVHIFWQKRIRAGDEVTPWWFPSKTDGGAIREDRIVLPIPPGTHWSDAKPLVLPGVDIGGEGAKELPSARRARVKVPAGPKVEPLKPTAIVAGGLRFADPAAPTVAAQGKAGGAEKVKRERKKFDPRLVAAARELRDRWLEQVGAGSPLLSQAKYEVSRAIEETKVVATRPPSLLDAA
jgi:hypothetical protein